jgi:hypothetical protein
MLVLGGTGRLYGAIIGTAAFMIAQDVLSGSTRCTGSSGWGSGWWRSCCGGRADDVALRTAGSPSASARSRPSTAWTSRSRGRAHAL